MCKLTLKAALCISCVAFLAATTVPYVNGQIAETGVGTKQEIICESIDIRNYVDNFKVKLANCTVIEGYLRIVLIEKPKHGQFDQLSFPDLVEVTHYVLLYRVYGLRSLSQIFPNLAVIRGQDLFYFYSLVIYETIDMEDIGLIGLTTIERGAVRLEKNPNLCYIDTIDWTKIVPSMQLSDHFFKGNKLTTECVNVPPENCPVTTVNGKREPRSWNLHHCQKLLDCPKGNNCPSGMCFEGQCCDPKCLGGCYGPKPSQCIACKNVIDSTQGYPHCIDHCSPGTYKVHNRRCLLDKECVEMGKFLVPFTNTTEAECAPDCPAGMSENNVSKCEKCPGRCPKVCPPMRVDSVDAAQSLKGCTYIKGALEIRISSGSNIAVELEENLGQIEEVSTYIWIHASHALLSLNFFRSLRRIGGMTLYNAKYALMVDDNSNLENLFPENTKNNLEILNGSMFFHFNRKLCYNKITDLLSSVKMNAKAENDISETNNGDQMPCVYATLNLTIFQVGPRVAFFRWENFKIADQRNLLSYVIHYKEAPVKNVSSYDGRHACSEDFWNTKDVLNSKSTNETYLYEILLKLKPWTQYAMYIETYTTALAKVGAISKVKYFRTAATAPTAPMNLNVRALKPNQLHLTWDPPELPNGNVTHYEVYWRKGLLDPKKYDVRNYCKSPVQRADQKQLEEAERDKMEAEKKKYQGEECCECASTSRRKKEEEQREREMQINFQNFLQTAIYIKREKMRGNSDRKQNIETYYQMNGNTNSSTSKPRKSRARRSPLFLDTSIANESLGNETEYNTTNVEETSDALGEETNPYYRAVVYKREFIIPNLMHYRDYNIEVIACQERDPREPKVKNRSKEEKLCSSRALALQRTMTSKVADNINSSSISIGVMKNKTGEVMLKWAPPPNPNGIIITYEIKYSDSNINNVQPITVCISQKMYKAQGGHKLINLGPGNYTFKIRANSLAGNGSWTEGRYFIIDSNDSKVMPQELIIVVCVVVGIFVVVVTGIIVWCMARRKFREYPDIQNISANPEYMSNYDTYKADDWEVYRDNVKLIRELGQGSFGMVYEGLASGLKEVDGEIRVAVKTVNSSATFPERMSFLNEASIMKAFVCSHVVRLLGVVSEGVAQGKPAYVIMELMSNGDLKNFLRMHRPDEEDNAGRTPPNLHRIMQMAGEIADGMAYLADKKFVHRDLAARNCMVADNLTVKIGDFGMTRDIYETDYYRKGGKGLLPVRWMAPESLKDGIFTSMSDVWSYGVVIWEMTTLAAQPYQGLSNEEVLKYVINAKTMDTPEGCPEILYQMMLQCWQYRPKTRPTFKQIIELLVPELDPEFKETSYFFNDGKVDSIDYDDEYCEELGQDDSHMPFISGEGSSGSGACLKHDDDLDFVDHTDTQYSGYPHRGTSEQCDCILLQETKGGGGGMVQLHNDNNYQFNAGSNSAIDSSNDGSKESSKSSNHSYNPINGVNLPPNLANGHVPLQMRTTTSC